MTEHDAPSQHRTLQDNHPLSLVCRPWKVRFSHKGCMHVHSSEVVCSTRPRLICPDAEAETLQQRAERKRGRESVSAYEHAAVNVAFA